jgi:hypothetical protein
VKSKVLIYDIETTPSLGYVWGKWQQDVLKFTEEWYIMCFAYKWLGEKQTHVVAQPDFKLYKKDKQSDYEVVKKLHELFNEADAVVAHNGNSFDQKKSQARMIIHGFEPPTPYKQVDTKLVARRNFNFNSNKLDDLGTYFGLGNKVQTGGFDLWLGCMAGDKKCWDKMKKYNKQDVVLLEKIYLKMNPWDKQSLPLNVIEDRPSSCPKCAREGTMIKLHKYTHVKSGATYQYFRCNQCSGTAKSRVPEDSFKKVDYVS